MPAATEATMITIGESKVTNVTVQSVRGAQLNFTPAREQEMYFQVRPNCITHEVQFQLSGLF